MAFHTRYYTSIPPLPLISNQNSSRATQNYIHNSKLSAFSLANEFRKLDMVTYPNLSVQAFSRAMLVFYVPLTRP